jgi:hypothetical protein
MPEARPGTMAHFRQHESKSKDNLDFARTTTRTKHKDKIRHGKNNQ